MHAKRQRATAIIELPQGILLVGMRNTDYLLPGGGVETGETPLVAAVREVQEETGLLAHRALFLFETTTLANHHIVFWVQAPGLPQPCAEIDTLAYYGPGSDLRISTGTHSILKEFAAYRRDHAALFAALQG
jgi:8-oxo-dGTP diphosphatase